MIERYESTALYVAIAALAGSITAVSLMAWRTMTWREIVMTIVVGCSFAVFVVPYAVETWVGVDLSNLRAICFFTYLGATGANAFVPVIIRRTSKAINRLLDRLFGPEEAA